MKKTKVNSASMAALMLMLPFPINSSADSGALPYESEELLSSIEGGKYAAMTWIMCFYQMEDPTITCMLTTSR